MTVRPAQRFGVGRGARVLLGLACVAVAFAAADTYVVVLALPDMMSGVGLGIDELQRAAPIVSGFLLGYVAMLPLLGRVADLVGRVPVLVGSLAVFAVGSLVTAAAYDLPVVVAGRFLQGVGAGGLIPATLALVADLWPPARRGLPLGVVGGVQEVGSVLGPLYGALVLAAFDWRAIFWLNLAFAAALALGLRLAGRSALPYVAKHRRVADDPLALVFAGAALAALALLLTRPDRLASDVTLGVAWVPFAGDSLWTTPLALALGSLLVALVVRELTATRPLVDLRATAALAHSTDLVGASLLGASLGCVVVAFATADPQVQVFSPAGPWLLLTAAATAALFWLRQRSADQPLLPRQALGCAPAWGSLVVSFFVGAALIAALVDIPVFARVTVFPDSQLGAALVLLRFLVAVPVGALLGGWLTRWVPLGPLTAAAMCLCIVGFLLMTTWDLSTLADLTATFVLALTGLGFGLAIAPVQSALLAATSHEVHGLASALLVVARMVGMLVGISALTNLGLRHFYAVAATLPPPQRVCASGASMCPAYTRALKEAGLAQMHAIFLGAAVCAGVAGLVALACYRRAGRAPVVSPDLLRVAG